MSGAAIQPGLGILLAQQEILDGIRVGMNAQPRIGDLIVFAIGAGALIALLVMARRCFGREGRRKPETRVDYLAEAAAILNLTQAEHEDLARLASRARLPQPAAILLSPANLAHAFNRGGPDRNDPKRRRRLDALSLKLFGQPLNAGSTGPRQSR